MNVVNLFGIGRFTFPDAGGDPISTPFPALHAEVTCTRNSNRLTIVFMPTDPDAAKRNAPFFGRFTATYLIDVDGSLGILLDFSPDNFYLRVPPGNGGPRVWPVDNRSDSLEVIDVAEVQQLRLRTIPGNFSREMQRLIQPNFVFQDRVSWLKSDVEEDEFIAEFSPSLRQWQWVRDPATIPSQTNDDGVVARAEFAFRDGYVNQSPREQQFFVRKVSFDLDPSSTTSVELRAGCCTPLFDLAPEMLDHRVAHMDDNPMIHHVSLANGDLCVRDTSAGTDPYDLTWEHVEGDRKDTLLLFHQLRDHDSLPVGLRIGSEHTPRPLKLGRRFGETRVIETDGDRTISGLQMGESLEPSDCALTKLRLETRATGSPVMTWARAGDRRRIEIDDAPPKQIHGPARNSFFALRNSDSEAPAGLAADDLPDDVGGPSARPIYQTLALHLGGNQWDLETVYEESGYGFQKKSSPAAVPVSRRTTPPDAADSAQLPAGDFRFAAANMRSTKIAGFLHDNYTNLDDRLIKVFAKAPVEIEEHSAQFKLIPEVGTSDAVATTLNESVVGRLRDGKLSFDSTASQPVTIASQSRASAQDGSESDSDNADGGKFAEFSFGRYELDEDVANRVEAEILRLDIPWSVYKYFTDGYPTICDAYQDAGLTPDGKKVIGGVEVVVIPKSCHELEARVKAARAALGALRDNALDRLEGFVEPGEEALQTVYLLAIISREVLQGVRDMYDPEHPEILASKLLDEANLEALWNRWVTGSDEERHLKRLAKRVQYVLDHWTEQGPINWPSEADLDAVELQNFKRIALRRAAGVLRIIRRYHDDLDRVHALLYTRLQHAIQTKEELTKVFQDVWRKLQTVTDEDSKNLRKRYTNPAADADRILFSDLKKVLLQTYEPSRDRFIRVLEAVLVSGDETLKDLAEAIDIAKEAIKETRVPQFKTLINQGLDEYWIRLKHKYETSDEDPFKTLREKIGIPKFNEDAYAEMLARFEELRSELEDVAKIVFKAEKSIELLKTLKMEPPEYLVFGKRFHIKYPPAVVARLKEMLAVWQRSFRLVHLGAIGGWDFQLDDETTAILKLTQDRTVEDILLEIQNQYLQDTGNLDALGLWTHDMDYEEVPKEQRIQPPTQVQAGDEAQWLKKLVRVWAERFLGGTIRERDWLGFVLINPLGDLSDNQVTRELCGLRFIRARYVAIGGGKDEIEQGEEVTEYLKLHAAIFKTAEKNERDPDADETLEPDADQPKPRVDDRDTALYLTKFDARISDSRLDGNSLIELKLDINRLWGRYVTDSGPNTDNYRDILIQGKVKMPDDEKLAPEFEFAMTFQPALPLEVDIAFIKTITFEAIRAGIRNGRTALEIDADIDLKSWPIPKVGEFESQKGAKLSLADFRLNLPDVHMDTDSAMGSMRKLTFDFGSVRLRLQRPRTFGLGIFDLKLKGLGFIRKHLRQDNTAKEILEFKDRYLPIVGGDILATEGDFPFIEFDVDFGKLPKFGRTKIEQLVLQMLFGVSIVEGDDPKPSLLLTGLDASDITIDFFRVLQLSIDRVYLEHDVEGRVPGKTQRLSILGAEDIRLSVLGFDLIGSQKGGKSGDEEGLYLLLLQNSAGQRGALGIMYNKPKKNSFIRIHWILLGHNVEVDPKVLTYLLRNEGRGTDVSWFNKLVEHEDPEDGEDRGKIKHVNAIVSGEEDWLFGISFGVSDFIKNCRLVFHDEHYYGISLTAEWLALMTGGAESITLAYIPGATAKEDRFLIEMPLPLFDYFMNMRSGWLTLWWNFNRDVSLGLGFPFRVGARYLWNRSFALYITIFEARFGFYVEKRTIPVKQGEGNAKALQLTAGLGFYIGLGISLGNSIVYARAGIGVFVILEGTIRILIDVVKPKDAILAFKLRGVIGIYAYVEGGINLWVISAHFRAEIQAALAGEITYFKDSQPMLLTYRATLYAGYYASVEVDLGFFSVTFTVEGELPVEVSGQYLLEG